MIAYRRRNKLDEHGYIDTHISDDKLSYWKKEKKKLNPCLIYKQIEQESAGCSSF